MRLPLMHCGRISVNGEAEEVICKKKKKAHHRKKKSSFNPYSTLGLDEFASLNAELSAKREYVARKTGTPEAMVRFVDTSKGLLPVVLKNGHDGKDKDTLYLPPIKSRGHDQSQENHGSKSRGKDIEKADEGCENGDNASSSSQMTLTVPVNMPWWSGYLQTTALGVLILGAIMVRKFAVPAVVMAVVMVVSSLQRQWMGGVMCTRSFIDTAVSYFSQLFIHCNRRSRVKTRPPKERLQLEAEQPVRGASPEHNIITQGSQGRPMLSLSAPCSPSVRNPNVFSLLKNSSKTQDFNTQLEVRKKKTENRQLGRIVSMDGQPRTPIRLQQSQDSFCAGKGEIDATLGAILILFLLFFLVFYGRLHAICFTSTYWYVLPMLRFEYKKRVISPEI